MATCYFERRKSSTRGSDSVSADVMRHLHTRQHLGKAVIIDDQPSIRLSVARKQWMRLSRTIQKQRAATLNADRILKLTHTIIHMQHLRFSSKAPLEEPEADLYFVRPDQINIPASCYTVYVTAAPAGPAVQALLQQLPIDALVVDYTPQTDWAHYGLLPKTSLEANVQAAWQQVRQFMKTQNIHLVALRQGSSTHIEAMDDALDMLLGSPHAFLRVADTFHRALELARPLRTTKELREQYDALMLLAHRVQTLTNAAFSHHFLESYSEDDTFFLYDAARKKFIWTGETLAEAVGRHTRAGRTRLAAGLQDLGLVMPRSITPRSADL